MDNTNHNSRPDSYRLSSRPNPCRWRHENGNCTIIGGFCTSVNPDVCKAVHYAYKEGREDAVYKVMTVCKELVLSSKEDEHEA